jgi:hypothetical protein
MSTVAETITWSQALITDGSELTFEVFDGVSETWGSFGRDMRITSAAEVTNLNQYNPEVTITNSCVTYGSNRVDEMVITQVRYYTSIGLVYVDPVPKVVYMLGDDE